MRVGRGSHQGTALLPALTPPARGAGVASDPISLAELFPHVKVDFGPHPRPRGSPYARPYYVQPFGRPDPSRRAWWSTDGFEERALGYLSREFFTFWRVGFAEFEGGVVPAALACLSERAPAYVTLRVDLPLTRVERDHPWRWDRARRAREDARRDKLEAGKTRSVWLLCAPAHRRSAEASIRHWAERTYHQPRRYATKEPLHLARALRRPARQARWEGEVAWLDLANVLFFSADRQLFSRAVDLFQGRVLP